MNAMFRCFQLFCTSSAPLQERAAGRYSANSLRFLVHDQDTMDRVRFPSSSGPIQYVSIFSSLPVQHQRNRDLAYYHRQNTHSRYRRLRICRCCRLQINQYTFE